VVPTTSHNTHYVDLAVRVLSVKSVTGRPPAGAPGAARTGVSVLSRPAAGEPTSWPPAGRRPGGHRRADVLVATASKPTCWWPPAGPDVEHIELNAQRRCRPAACRCLTLCVSSGRPPGRATSRPAGGGCHTLCVSPRPARAPQGAPGNARCRASTRAAPRAARREARPPLASSAATRRGAAGRGVRRRPPPGSRAAGRWRW